MVSDRLVSGTEIHVENSKIGTIDYCYKFYVENSKSYQPLLVLILRGKRRRKFQIVPTFSGTNST